MVVLARLTGWDTRAEMAASIVLASLFLGLRRLLSTLQLDRLSAGIVSTAAALVVFSPLQWENWLWGWQIQWYLSVAALVGAIVVLHCWPSSRSPVAGLVPAGGAAIVGQYSLASGTFIWAAALVILLAQRRYRTLVPAWLAAASVCTILYVSGYTSPPGHPPLADFRDVEELVAYLSTYIGRSLTTEGWADSAGLLVATATIVVVSRLVVIRASLRRCAPWLRIFLFGGCSATATALGRAGFGAEQGGSSRYTTISSLLILSLCVLASIAIDGGPPQHTEQRMHRHLAVATTPFLLVGALLVVSAPSAIEQMRAEGADRA